MKKLCVLALLGICGSVFARDQQSWIATWASSPTGAATGGKMGPFTLPPPTTLKGTMRYRLRISQGGTQVRLRLSNEYGEKPLTVNAVTIGLAATGLDAVSGSLKKVTFGGSEVATMPAGAPALSDPIDLKLTAFADVIVSVYMPEGTSITLCPANFPIVEQAAMEDSNATNEAHLPVPKCTFFTRPIVSEIDVLGSKVDKVIVALGDSITDGRIDPATGDRGWPAVLARRIQGKGFAVINAGIAGNRLLGSIPMLGAATLARLDRDTLTVPGTKYILMLEGINDIGASGPGTPFGDFPLADPKELIAAYSQIIARAHERGIKVIGATLLPFEGAMVYTAEKEPIRAEVNHWIRSSSSFDGIVDFDAAVRDSASPKRFDAAYDSGDHLHPNDAGYRKMGEAIDLKLFN